MRTKTFFFLLIISNLSLAQTNWVGTFESLNFEKSDTFWNGSDASGGVLVGRAFFNNNYNKDWSVWDGFSVSNSVDSSTKGFTNQYSVYGDAGANRTEHFAVFGEKGVVTLNKPQVVRGCYINNATYPALSMRDGDNFAKKFGGATGNDEDYFRIIATGHNGTSISTDSFYLADYRFSDNSKDYILNHWAYFDLSGLGTVDSISFSLQSSDTGQFGMNTPAFFCLDNFNAPHPEDTIYHSDFETAGLKRDSFLNGSEHDGGFEFNGNYFTNSYNHDWNAWQGWSVSSMTDTVQGTFTNQYSSIAGSGVDQSTTYLTGYVRTSVLLSHSSATYTEPAVQHWSYNCAVSNSTYGYKTMKNGDSFAKKFGGPSGNDKDYLVLKISGVDYYGQSLDTLEHYLADFRFDDNSKDYISDEWEILELGSLIFNTSAVRLDFWLEGSDTGQFGLNTPAYFCIDDFFDFNTKLSTPEVKRLVAGIYPNPASDRLYVDIDAPIKSLMVTDIQGRKVHNQQGAQRYLNIGRLPAGTYVLRIETKDGMAVTKFVKE